MIIPKLRILEPISTDEVYDIHMATLRVLEEIGVRVDDISTLELLRDAGCDIDAKARVAKIPQHLVALDRIQPQKTKKQLLRGAYDKRPKPAEPNELWETDLTYVFCGIDGWVFLFNIRSISGEFATCLLSSKADAFFFARSLNNWLAETYPRLNCFAIIFA